MKLDLNAIDSRIAGFMGRRGLAACRFALAVVFIWFGVLKPLRISPAEPLVLQTVTWMPVFDPQGWLFVIGWWEVLIGVCFLFHRTIRVAIGLLFLQMVGTFMPLFMLPEITFQAGRIPYGPTLVGQYILKNLVIIAVALVIGGTVRRDTTVRREAAQDKTVRQDAAQDTTARHHRA